MMQIRKLRKCLYKKFRELFNYTKVQQSTTQKHLQSFTKYLRQTIISILPNFDLSEKIEKARKLLS